MTAEVLQLRPRPSIHCVIKFATLTWRFLLVLTQS